ncbi:MAG: helix-hairpin-helix domain-containing protein [Coprococcus sp.]
MDRKYNYGTLLMIVFVVVTGILFCCDHRAEMTDEPEPAEELSVNSDKESEAVETICQTEVRKIYVYVCGKVNEPDVYELEPGARLFEAIEAAGGVCKEADLDRLNLADILEDGEKIYVPAEGETVESSEDTEDKSSDGRVNINTATVEQLQTLPGIGEAKANAIIAYRDANGAFASVEELREVPGIKDGIFGQIQSLIRAD